MNDDIEQKVDELNEKVDELTTLMEESNRMTKNLYQRARMATVVVFIKWFIIIGITLGSFYYIQPLINNLVGIYGGISSLGGSSSSDKDNEPKSGFNFGDLSNLIKSI